jgi:hypothetical protein
MMIVTSNVKQMWGHRSALLLPFGMERCEISASSRLQFGGDFYVALNGRGREKAVGRVGFVASQIEARRFAGQPGVQQIADRYALECIDQGCKALFTAMEVNALAKIARRLHPAYTRLARVYLPGMDVEDVR